MGDKVRSSMFAAIEGHRASTHEQGRTIMSLKRSLAAALVGSLIAGSALAAAAQTATGVIKTIDPDKKDIVLDSGATYMLPAKFDLKKISVGEKVKVTYTTKGDEMVASKVVTSK
jgi:Cu/Ag efflux protein CusF